MTRGTALRTHTFRWLFGPHAEVYSLAGGPRGHES